MNIKEAFEILGIPTSASSDEIKSKFRELAKKYHPDVCKDPDAHEKFKKINEANTIAQDFKAGKINENSFFNPYQNVDWGGGFRRNVSVKDNEPPKINIKISFKESVLGCERNVSFKRYITCSDCEGEGFKLEKNDCTDCDGFGRVIKNDIGIIFSYTCKKCKAQNIKRHICNSCNEEGIVFTETSVKVTVPSGIENGQIIRLRGAGHHLISPFGIVASDAYIYISVEENNDMKINGNDVESMVNISLLEALTGCTKKLNTVYDTVDVVIPSKSKNKDIISIAGHGVKNTKGSHNFIIIVNYPENVDDIVSILKETN